MKAPCPDRALLAIVPFGTPSGCQAYRSARMSSPIVACIGWDRAEGISTRFKITLEMLFRVSGVGRRPDPRTSGLIRTGRIPGERSQPRPDPAPMRALSRCRTDVDLGHAVGVAGETHLFARQLCQPRTRNVQASVTRSFIGIVAKCTSQTRAVLSSDCAYQLRTLAPWQHLRARATTKLYDRTTGIIMLDEVERIVI